MGLLDRVNSDIGKMSSNIRSTVHARHNIRLRRQLQSDLPGQWVTDHRKESEKFTGWNFVSLHAVAKQCAQAEVAVKQKVLVEEDKKTKKDPVPDSHPLMQIMEKPNPSESGATMRYECALQMGLTGSVLIWQVRNQLGKTVELYVIPTAAAQPVQPSQEYKRGGWKINPYFSSNVFDEDGYLLNEGYQAALGRTISTEDMLVIRWPHPFFKSDGYSPVSAGAWWLDTADQIDNARWSHMRNGPDPSILIEPPEDIEPTEEELDAASTRFNAKYAGTENSGKAMFVPHGKVTPLTTSPVDMSYSEGFDQFAGAIRALHGTPGTAIGITEQMTYGALAASMRQFTVLTVQPLLSLIASELTAQLGPEFGNGLSIELTSQKVDDPDLLEKQIQTDITVGAITIGELRELRGREPFGDKRDEKPAQAAPADLPGGTPEGMSGPSEKKDLPEFGSTTRQQWNRNVKAIQDVLDSVINGGSPVVAAQMLQMIGVSTERADVMINDVQQGKEEKPDGPRDVPGYRGSMKARDDILRALGMSEGVGTDGGFTVLPEHAKVIRDKYPMESDGVIDVWRDRVTGAHFVSFGDWIDEDVMDEWISRLDGEGGVDYEFEVSSPTSNGDWEHVWPIGNGYHNRKDGTNGKASRPYKAQPS